MAVKVFVNPQQSLDYDNAQSAEVDRNDGTLNVFTEGGGTLVATYAAGSWHHVDVTN